MHRVTWMSKETRLGRCNETTCNEHISCHVCIYINRWLLILENTISPNILEIKVKCVNYQPILSVLTLATNIV